MFDMSWQELFLVGLVALIAIGPKDLPLAMRATARFIRKMRGLSREFQSSVAEVMREAELDDLRRRVERAGSQDIGETIRRAVDPAGGLTSDFDPAEFAERLKRDVEAGPPTRPAAPTADGAAAPDAAALPAADDGAIGPQRPASPIASGAAAPQPAQRRRD